MRTTGHCKTGLLVLVGAIVVGEPSHLLTLVQWQTVCRSGVRVTMIYSGQNITKLRQGRVFDPTGTGRTPYCHGP